METFAGRGVVFVYSRAQAHKYALVNLGGTMWGEARGQREVNKYKFLEIKDSVLVPSLCPAPDAMCNSK